MRRRHFTWMSCGVVLACLGVIQSGRAQSGVPAAGFTPLIIAGSPNALSADGTVIVGQFTPTGATNVHAFRWTEVSGQVDLGGLFGVDVGATSASADGSVVVGFGDAPWRLTPQTGMVPLIPFPPGFHSGQANDVSADGTVVVGTINGANLPGGVGFWEPFRWTPSTGYFPLGNLGAPQTNGAAVSADGAVVVGFSNFGSHVEAFRWTAQTGMVGLGTVPGFPNSMASDVSADGTVVVGTFAVNFAEAPAFRWTAQEGMVSLGDFSGGQFETSARAVSADGSVIVGSARAGNPGVDPLQDSSAFIWDAVHGVRALRDVLLEQGTDVTGWHLSYPFGMSADGHVIGGVGINPSGAPQPWLARLAEAPSCAQPAISSITATPSVLWPPNHKMVSVSVLVDATAACGPPVCAIASVASNEPGDGAGDIEITAALRALLRSERSGGSMGRTYTISVACRDAARNEATGTTTVQVPHDRGK